MEKYEKYNFITGKTSIYDSHYEAFRAAFDTLEGPMRDDLVLDYNDFLAYDEPYFGDMENFIIRRIEVE